MSGPEDVTGEQPDASAAAHEEHGRRSAAAARRARRIGGRVPGTDAHTERAEDDQAEAATKKSPSLAKKPSPAATEPVAGEPARPAHPAEPAAPAAVPAWLRWLPAAVLSAGAIVMAVLLVVFSNGIWWSKPSGQALRDQVLAAAKTCLATTNTYKYTDLDSYERKSMGCVSGPLAHTLRHTIDTLVKVNAPKIQASQTAQINTGGIENISPDGKQWTVLIFGQLAVTNTNYPQGRTDPFGAQVQMQKIHGQWLMTNVRTVSSLS